jgi:hypothetical protein
MPTVSILSVPDFAPLDAQFAADVKLFYPAALGARWHKTDSIHVLIDGAKIENLAELLDTANVPHVCLFDGDLSGFAGAAPWLATLPLQHKLTRALFSAAGAAPVTLWPKAAALFIETDLPLTALRKHFRRFLRVADAAGQMHFFRFWEPSTCAAYFMSVGDSDDLTMRWFCPREGGHITALLVPDTATGALNVITPVDLPVEAPSPQGPFILRDTDHAAMARARLTLDLAAMVALLTTTFPEKLTGADPAETDLFARRTMSRMHDYGFMQQDHLFTLLSWELHYGPFFENRDPEGQLRQICEAPLPEGEKFALLSERVATFE